MNPDDAILEDALRDLTPSRIDHDLLGRLHTAMDAASASVASADASMEAMLAASRPAALPDALFHRLVGLADADTAKVVEMPSSGRVIPFRRYAAAAAIALAGAAAALLAPMGGERSANTAAADAQAPAPATIPAAAAREFVPAGYDRGLSDARDEGVVWKDNAAHRVLRIVYTDTITLRNEAGEIVEVEQPRVEYIVVPKKID